MLVKQSDVEVRGPLEGAESDQWRTGAIACPDRRGACPPLYLEAWLGGSGAVPLYNLERIHHGAKLDDGRTVDEKLYRLIRDQELASIGERPAYDELLRLEQS